MESMADAWPLALDIARHLAPQHVNISPTNGMEN
jgi:hypothetical protein